MDQTRVLVQENLTDIIEISADKARVDVVEEIVALVEVGVQGPPGPPGPEGIAFAHVHTQTSAEAEWVVNHNLGARPNVEVRNTGGAVVLTDIVHQSTNQLRIYFAFPVAGEARCI